jgi:hypothetical protein
MTRNLNGLVLSPDGKRYAWRTSDSVVVDGVAGRSYKWVGLPSFSRDGRRFAYAASVGGGENLVVLDGTEGQRYAKVGTDMYDVLGRNVIGLKFSADGDRLAYVAVKPKGRQVLVIDGAEGGEYDSVGNPTFSADGRRVAHTATRAGAHLLVVDGREQDLGKADVSGLVFSPDGRQLAYVTRLDRIEAVTVGDAKGSGFDKVSSPCFGSDGRVAYMARRKSQRFVVIDGREGKAYDWIGRPYFSPDGKRVAHAASQGGFVDEKVLPDLRYKSRGARYGVITDGVEGTWFDGPVLPWIQFSPDSARMAYWVMGADKWRLMVDETKSIESDAPGSAAFSPDGKRLAYTTSTGRKKERKALVVVDGVPQKEYSSVWTPVFSPDSRHLAYVATVGEKRFLVIDGLEALQDEGFWNLEGGTHTVSAYDLDNDTEVEIGDKVGFAFEGPNVVNAIGRRGLELYRVRVEISNGTAVR